MCPRCTICLDGEYSNPETLKFSGALQYGEGVFETIRVKEGKAEYLKLHLERLSEGAKFINTLVPDVDYESLIKKLLKKNELAGKLAKLKIILFKEESPHFYLAAEPYNPPDSSNYATGVRLFTARHPYCESEVARIKSICRLPYMKLREKAVEKGCFDCLLTSCDEEILESTVANLLIWDGENFFVPPVSSYRLRGIMERVVVEELKRDGFGVCEKKIGLKDLTPENLPLITNSLIGVMPVRTIGKTTFRIAEDGIIRTLINKFSPFEITKNQM